VSAFASDFREIVSVSVKGETVTRRLACSHEQRIAKTQLNSIARANPEVMIGRSAPCPECAAATPTKKRKR
jgi:hypothetical protein